MVTIDKRTKRFISERDRATAKARAVEDENARLKARIERMRPVVDAANRLISGVYNIDHLRRAIEAYRERKAVRR